MTWNTSAEFYLLSIRERLKKKIDVVLIPLLFHIA